MKVPMIISLPQIIDERGNLPFIEENKHIPFIVQRVFWIYDVPGGEKGFEKLVAKVPLKEMSSYSTSLSSLTGGRASFIMKFASYELVPSDVQDKLIKDHEAKQVKEE